MNIIAQKMGRRNEEYTTVRLGSYTMHVAILFEFVYNNPRVGTNTILKRDLKRVSDWLSW